MITSLETVKTKITYSEHNIYNWTAVKTSYTNEDPKKWLNNIIRIFFNSETAWLEKSKIWKEG